MAPEGGPGGGSETDPKIEPKRDPEMEAFGEAKTMKSIKRSSFSWF